MASCGWTSEGGSSEIAPRRSAMNGGRARREYGPSWLPIWACPAITLMAHHMSNHIAVAYGDIFGEMVAVSQELGFRVRIISHAN
jgi:hypothetical protein